MHLLVMDLGEVVLGVVVLLVEVFWEVFLGVQNLLDLLVMVQTGKKVDW